MFEKKDDNGEMKKKKKEKKGLHGALSRFNLKCERMVSLGSEGTDVSQ